MNKKELIYNFIKELVLSSGRRDIIETKTHLFSTGILDSISGIKLIIFLEKSFGFKAEVINYEINKLDTIEEIYNYVGINK
jgi:acyl carrier protein